jgi:copper chaperone CopZ
METKLKVEGMHCRSCEMLITDALSELEGVKKAKVNHRSGEVAVDFDDSKIKKEAIINTIKNEGYKVIR